MASIRLDLNIPTDAAVAAAKTAGEQIGKNIASGVASGVTAAENSLKSLEATLNKMKQVGGVDMFAGSMSSLTAIENRVGKLVREVERVQSLMSRTGGPTILTNTGRVYGPGDLVGGSGRGGASEARAAAAESERLAQSVATSTARAGRSIESGLTTPLRGALSTLTQLDRLFLRISFSVFAIERIGRAMGEIGAAPFEAVQHVVDATSDSRRFELSIAGVTGAANARAIDAGIGRGINSTALSLADTRQMVTGLAHVGPIAQQLALASPAQAESLISNYSNTIAGLQAMNPQSTTAEIVKGVEGALLGQGRALRTVVQIDPDQLAQLVGRGGMAAFRGNPELLMQALQRYEMVFGPSGGASSLNDFPDVQLNHIRDQFTNALSQIGDSGLFENVTTKLKTFADSLATYFDPSNAAWAQKAKSLGTSLGGIFDGMTSAGATLVQTLSGADSPARNIAELVNQLDSMGRAIAKVVPPVANAVAYYGGSYVHSMAVGATDSLPHLWDNLQWIARGYSADGPYGRGLVNGVDHLPVRRGAVGAASAAGSPYLRQIQGYLDTESILRSWAMNGADYGLLSGGYTPERNARPELIRANAMDALSHLSGAGPLGAEDWSALLSRNWGFAKAFGGAFMSGDTAGTKQIGADWSRQMALMSLMVSNRARIPQSIAEEGFMEALATRGTLRGDAFANALTGDTELARAARAMGLSTGAGGLMAIPADVRWQTLDSSVQEIIRGNRSVGGGLVGKAGELGANVQAYQMALALAQQIGSPDLAGSYYLSMLNGRYGLVENQAAQIQRYGGIIRPGMSSADLHRMAMSPEVGSLLGGQGRSGSELQMYEQALQQANQDLDDAKSKITDYAHATDDQKQAVAAASAAVADMTSKINDLKVKASAAAESFIEMGNSIQSHLTSGIGNALTQLELTGHAKQAWRQMGAGLLGSVNNSMMQGIMDFGFGKQDGKSGAGHGMGGLFGMAFDGITGMFRPKQDTNPGGPPPVRPMYHAPEVPRTEGQRIFGDVGNQIVQWGAHLLGNLVGQFAGAGMGLGDSYNVGLAANQQDMQAAWAAQDYASVYNDIDPASMLGSVPGHASGGVFSTPHLAAIAELGQSEAVIPLMRDGYLPVDMSSGHAVLPGGRGVPIAQVDGGSPFSRMGLNLSGAGSVSGYGPGAQAPQQPIQVHNYNLFDRDELAMYGFHRTRGAILNDVAREARPGGKLHRAIGHK